MLRTLRRGTRRAGEAVLAVALATMLTLVLALAGADGAAAQDLQREDDFNKGGRTALQFLKIGIGARQSGLGEASIATVRDVNAAFWNPAGLSGIDRTEISFSYIRWLADLNYVAGVAGFRWNRVGLFALSVAALDYGEINEALVTAPSGSNDTRTGNTFGGGDLLVGLSYAREFTDRLTLGVTAKFIREELFEYAESTFSFDVGTNYDLGFRGMRLAMSAQNFGGSVKWLEESNREEGYDTPLIFRIGLAADLLGENGFLTLPPGHRVVLSAEAINTNDFSERLHLGAEYWFNNFLALRGGYRFNYAEGNLSLGFGLDAGAGDLGVRLDYAYVQYEYLNAPHRLSLSVAF